MEPKDFSPFLPHGITFGTYTDDEILGLSVKELTNPQSFDSLQHPTSGGLYDPALGPQDRDDQCETCGQMSQWCPGHMGHISLPLPVYNPVFFKNLFQILKGTCFSCNRLLARGAQCSLITHQLTALDHGLLHIVGEMQDLYSNVLNEQGTDLGMEDTIQRQLEECLTSALSLNIENGNSYQVKHITEMKQQLIKQFLKDHLIPKGKICGHCKMPVKPMRSEHNTKIFFQKGLDRKSAREMIEKKNRQKQQRKQALQEGNSEYLEDEVVEMEDEINEPSEDLNEKEVSAISEQLYLTPMEARSHIRKVWSNDKAVFMKLFGALIMKNSHKYPTDIFFLDVVPVAPNRFRPMAVMKERKYEHPQSGNLSKVLLDAITIRQILADIQRSEKEGADITRSEEETTLLESVPGKSLTEKLQNVWVRMQTHVNCVVDSELDKMSTDKHPGIKQLLEKKEGLFRKHMMGKRVNYAARSVISPDPYINTDEIGIPMVFALKLTYPQPVTPWNVQELRQAVINGPRQHPGAVFVENEDGTRIMLNPTDVRQREAIAKELLTPSTFYHGPPESKKVLRHLKNGDVLLLNRQPTLHRPSIQAHKARVLPAEKTLRLHYANCKAYNADFDGDEMNAHFVQDEIARAEAYTIASTNFQYLVPKDGTPLAGLIQDHMVSGVMLTMRGRFFSRGDYQQLVYAALTDKYGPVKMLRPGMIKPVKLWSGKQVLSTVLLNLIPEGKPALNLHGKAKIAGKNWLAGQPRAWLAGGQALKDESMSESEVVVRSGELLCGVLDKGHYGPTPYGLVHCCYELYGGVVACKLLTSLAKLFTTFLQQHGFTLGPEDILVTPQADVKRKKNVDASRLCGDEAAAKAMGVDSPDDTKTLLQKLEKAHYNKDGRHMMELDLAMKQKTDEYQNNIAKVCIPHGLQKIFPNNNLQLMVQSGAKGSSVNCMQISCLLGQIELEGRRPPLMLSGRSLPSFLPYDTSPRAGGFVDGRFLTGIRPQEYFYHCMAGREGLIDTAVKTSRSGYLQRCIIKHLEGIMVNYDMSVRDSDGSVVQFQYGEDSLDILKTPFLNKKQFPFLISNQNVVLNETELKRTESIVDTTTAGTLHKKLKKWHKKNPSSSKTRTSGFLSYSQKVWGSITEQHPDTELGSHGRSKATEAVCAAWWQLEEKKKRKLEKRHSRCPDPVAADLSPARYFGSLSERMLETMDEYIKTNPDNLLVDDTETPVTPGHISTDRFKTMLFSRTMNCLAEPGEAVGLLAAQSIGEPSTQMTLNTFHFAGRGEMNVTLGIPRLREILMVASANIKTPNMDIPILNTEYAKKKAKPLQLKLNKVVLAQVLEDVKVCEYLAVKNKVDKSRMYRLTFKFLPYETYKKDFCVTPNKVLSYMEKKFIRHLCDAVKKRILELSKAKMVSTATVVERKRPQTENEPVNNTANEEDDLASDDDLNDGDAAAVKERERQMQERDYQGEEEEKEEVGEEEEESDEDLEDEDWSIDGSSIGQSESDMSRPVTPEPGLASSKVSKKKSKKKKRKVEMDEIRVNAVLCSHQWVHSYTYDADSEEKCQVTLKLALSDTRFDMASLIESEARRAVVHQVQGITRAILGEVKTPGQEGTHLRTEGVNIVEMYQYDRVLDLDRLYTNDIHAIAETYGIEAAARAILKECRDVFAAYGIQVDYRHLSLIADYMTFEGSYKPFNRMGIESNSSPLQKMSFETTMHFLKQTTISGSKDDLKSPSARLVVGRVVDVGTGSFGLRQPLIVS